MTEVRAIAEWPSNAHMIADVAMLGYLDGAVLDATYGEGTFWKCWRPERLATNDLHKPADMAVDYRDLSGWYGQFDAVVFDPPYKLSGTPALGGRKADRFDFVSNGRPQPPGRRQLTARRNHSTLLVFERRRMPTDDQGTLL